MNDPIKPPGDQTGAEQQPPRIDFPCSYPIKIMGLAGDDFSEEVVAVCRRHASEVTDEQVTVRSSSKGNYVAVTVVIQATGTDQLEKLFADLKAVPSVKMVL